MSIPSTNQINYRLKEQYASPQREDTGLCSNRSKFQAMFISTTTQKKSKAVEGRIIIEEDIQ
jgi:hypothetical protein